MIGKIITNFKNNICNVSRFYQKIMHAVFVILFSIMAVIVFVSYSYIGKTTSAEYQKLIEDSLKSIDKNFTQVINNTTGLCISIYNSTEGTRIRLQEENEIISNSFSKEILEEFYNFPFVHSFCGLTKENRKVFFIYNSNIGKYCSMASEKQLKEVLNESKGQSFPELWTADNRYAGKEKINLLSVYYRMASPQSEHYKGTVAANIDLIELSEYLFETMENGNVVYYLLNQNGEVIASSEVGLNGNDWSDKEWVQNIFVSKSTEMLLQKQEIEGTIYEFYSIPSEKSYFYVVAQSMYQNRIMQIHGNFIPMIAAFFVITMVGLGFLGFVSLKIFDPLNKVFEHIRSLIASEDNELKMDEIKMINFYHHLLQNRVESLQEKDIKNQIVKGVLQAKSVDELLIASGYMQLGMQYRMIVLFLNFRNEKKMHLREYDNYRNLLEERCMEKLSELGECTSFVMGFRRLMILLEEKENYSGLEQMLEQFFYPIAAEHGFQIIGYVSDGVVCEEEKEICINLYEKAESYLRMTRFMGNSKPIRVLTEISESSKWETDFQRACQCAKQRDWNGLEGNVRSLLQELLGQSWELCRAVLLQLVFNIENMLGTENRVFSNQIMQDIDSMESQEEFIDLLKAIFEHGNNQIQQKEKDRLIPIMEKVMNYINENYSDTELNLNRLADNMHISASYLGKLFQDFSGRKFNEYLMSVRLEHSCELLLLERNMSVAMIGEAVGYSNSSYFIAQFKKAYGVTPSAYRRMHDEELI